MDWLKALDFENALSNVRTDIGGDWYRDPWGWCELDWVVPKHLEEIALPRLNSTGVRATVPLDVPKENFAVRPAVVLDPLDRLLYQALIDRFSRKLIGDLQPWIYGWRLPVKDARSGAYSRNDAQWKLFRRHLRRLADFDTAALTTDVVSFFGSIPIDPLAEQIEQLGTSRPVQRLVDMVSSWYRTTGRGLPQRSGASAVLAHAYLRPIDDLLEQYNPMPRSGRLLVPRGRTLRWMDDIWLFGRSVLGLRDAQLAIQGALRQLGLELNVGKTAVLEGEEMVEAVFQIEHSAVDSALDKDDPDGAPLEALIEKITTEPERTERTTVRFATTRVRSSELFEGVPELADATPRLPHAADHLARLFRDSEHWRDLQEWYAKYSKRWRRRLPWTVGQLGTMFPSDAKVKRVVSDVFMDALGERGTALPVLSVASQRLAAWRPRDARVVFRELASTESDPFAVRSLALAALHAEEVPNVVRRMLRQHEENSVVLAMLEDSSFDVRAIPVAADFA